jgi:hypothetical protein
MPTFADRGCHVVSATDPAAVNPSFKDRSRYFFGQVAPQLSSRGWVDPVPYPLLLRKSGSAGNRTRNLWICSQKLWPLDHGGGLTAKHRDINIKFFILYRFLALGDIFLHVMLIVIMPGTKGTCFEFDMKAEIGQDIRLRRNTRFHPNTLKQRLLVSLQL